MKTRENSLRSASLVEYEPTVRDNRPATASDYLQHFKRFVRRAANRGTTELLVVLYVRVSSSRQKRNANAEHQLAYLRRQVAKIGNKYGVTIRIVAEHEEDVSGWKLWASGRTQLVAAANSARKHAAILVAMNTSRLVRNQNFHRNGAAPTVDDFKRLVGIVGTVQLATVLEPNKHEDRSDDTKRGLSFRKAQSGSPQNGTPGYKKERRANKRGLVMFLHRRGWSVRKIAAKGMVSVPKSTVARWVNNDE